jgi:hypothetical protein
MNTNAMVILTETYRHYESLSLKSISDKIKLEIQLLQKITPQRDKKGRRNSMMYLSHHGTDDLVAEREAKIREIRDLKDSITIICQLHASGTLRPTFDLSEYLRTNLFPHFTDTN